MDKRQILKELADERDYINTLHRSIERESAKPYNKVNYAKVNMEKSFLKQAERKQRGIWLKFYGKQ